MLISSGFTDDLFPADEALRYYHRTRDTHPGTPLALFFGNFGHQRAQNRAADANLLRSREDAWLDFYVKGVGTTPFQGAEAQTLTCPSTVQSGGPVQAANWARMSPGEVRFTSKAAQSLTPGAGSTALGAAFDPVTASQNPCVTASGADQPGVANYRLPAAKSAFTMMGAATVIADIDSPTANSALLARLFDVAPDGQETLVNRGTLRPAVGSARQVFQLHPNGWQFAEGHVPKLELLPRDAGSSALNTTRARPMARARSRSSNLELRLPVLQKVGRQRRLREGTCQEVRALGLRAGQGLRRALPTGNARLGKGKLRIGRRARRSTRQTMGLLPRHDRGIRSWSGRVRKEEGQGARTRQDQGQERQEGQGQAEADQGRAQGAARQGQGQGPRPADHEGANRQGQGQAGAAAAVVASAAPGILGV